MSLLIDGYNLLYGVGILGADDGRVGLERSLTAMLNFLAESIAPDLLRKTTVVFDSVAPGFSRVGEYRGMTVRFAGRGRDADTLLEELLRAEHAPRRLTVVSSDHRIQRAARRRRARAVDSDVWYGELLRERRTRETSAQSASGRTAVPQLSEDVDYWLRQFGGQASLDEWLHAQQEAVRGVPPVPAASAPADSPPDSGKPTEDLWDLENPFPPGYGEDLLQE